ncbi:MAG: NAD-dependent malic enzyme [Deferribacteraceae bacterium]|jgi:malate dehydrogenase (oxaloacetate-decarboxylating)(NADP+)|nr:NAD-dependent malic enzyme [Deferribacteraceae bacterium]
MGATGKKFTKEEALLYHSAGRPGKIEVIATKECKTQRDLSLAYSPGVAHACEAIKQNPEDARKYTAKGNLVAVLSNGTAVLGLGNIGPLAGKPVMEGKGILFKRFADVDVFDIEVNAPTAADVISVCRMLEPTFGGINLEDIRAPECFEIEAALQDLSIPVFHDDQHGTAIIAGAAVLNACEVVGKKMNELKVVINGAGASGISIGKHLVRLGILKDNLIMCDTKGVIYEGREEGMNEYKEEMAAYTDRRTLAEAAHGADVLMGLSSKGAFSDEMIRNLAPNPIIMAMANPDPEITPEAVAAIRTDAIVCTGRSDYPNQVNNVLCFPFIFRGALDVCATTINDEMKMAASLALSKLAKEPVTDEVKQIFPDEELTLGRTYIIPKAFDSRALTWVASAVAQAAMDTNVAKQPIKDMEEYKKELIKRMMK